MNEEKKPQVIELNKFFQLSIRNPQKNALMAGLRIFLQQGRLLVACTEQIVFVAIHCSNA
jgi:hypothetical protein